MGRFGDENGVFWFPPPGSTLTPGVKRKPGGSQEGKPRGPKAPKRTGTIPEVTWAPPTDFPRLHGVIGFDVETDDPGIRAKQGSAWAHRGSGRVIGFSVSWDGGREARYYPLFHEGGDNVLDPQRAIAWIKDIIADQDVQLVCHNSPYELGWMKRWDVVPAKVPICTQVAAALLDEYRRYKGGYNLDAVSKDYLGVEGGKEQDVLKQAAAALGLHPKNDLWRIPGRFVGPYGEADASLAVKLWQTLEPKIREEGLDRVFDLELRYTRVITEQRWRGVRIDVDKGEQLIARFKKEEADLSDHMKTLAGFEAPIWNALDLARAFKARGIVVPEENGQPSITQGWLRTIDDPYALALRQSRRINKARTTFIESLLDKVINGRVHSEIKALPTDEGGAVSGRSSSQNPNQQNQPSKDKDPEMGALVRGLWLPEEGCEWASLDYSQQEPRLAVHFAELAEVPGAKEIADIMRARDIDFHQMVADLAGITRKRAKVLNLALIYGKGPVATCIELGFPTEWVKGRNGQMREVAGEEGLAFMAAYHNAVPFVSGLRETVGKTLKRRGYLKTILGRRCRFGGYYTKDHAAVNRIVQGSAGDQLKKAQVDAFEQLGEIPMVAVHDEGGYNKTSDAQINGIVDIMVHTIELTVPVKVDAAFGKTWGEAA